MSLFKKNVKASEQVAEEQVHDMEVGTAAEVDEVMKKYDRESNTRVWEGVPKLIVKSIMIAFSLFCLYLTLYDTSLPEFRLCMFLAFVIIIGILMLAVLEGE